MEKTIGPKTDFQRSAEAAWKCGWGIERRTCLDLLGLGIDVPGVVNVISGAVSNNLEKNLIGLAIVTLGTAIVLRNPRKR